MGGRFGDPSNPLLLSVRSGARVSMPGMMETVLNLGLNDRIAAGLIERTGDARFAYDVYRRFVQMYGDVVMGLRPESREEEDPFEELLEKKKQARGVELDSELSAADLEELVGEFKALIRRRLKRRFPEDPAEQLQGAIGAVFRSWNGGPRHPLPRAGGHPPRVGHGGERAVHGLRQHGRRLRHRRGLHPRPLHRGEDALRRVPDQRPGRGRGRRHPHAGAGGPPREGAAGGLPPVQAGLPSARAPLPGDAGPRVHHPERPPVDAADALRQAHRGGGGEDRRRHGQGTADLAEGGAQAGLPGGSRPAPAPLLRPRGAARRSSARGCPPRPGRPPAGWCSIRRMRRRRPPPGGG